MRLLVDRPTATIAMEHTGLCPDRETAAEAGCRARARLGSAQQQVNRRASAVPPPDPEIGRSEERLRAEEDRGRFRRRAVGHAVEAIAYASRLEGCAQI